MPNITDFRNDPLRNFKFQVSITKSIATQGSSPGRKQLLARAGFMSVNGLGIQTEAIRYREGGMNTTTHKIPGQSDFPSVTLQRGVFANSENGPAFWQWQKELFYYLQGAAKLGTTRQPDFRTDITIFVLDHPRTNTGPQSPGDTNLRGTDKLGIKLHNAWPTSTAFNDLDAGSNSIMVEQIQLTHEGMEVVYDTTGNGGLQFGQ